MKNLRYANAAETLVQCEDDADNTLNIPNPSPGNRHFEAIRARIEAGEVAPYAPDPHAIDPRLAKAEGEFVRRMLTTDKSADQVAAELKAELAAGDVKAR